MQWLNKKFAILVLLVSILMPNARTGAIAKAPTMTEEAVQAAIFDSATNSEEIGNNRSADFAFVLMLHQKNHH